MTWVQDIGIPNWPRFSKYPYITSIKDHTNGDMDLEVKKRNGLEVLLSTTTLKLLQVLLR